MQSKPGKTQWITSLRILYYNHYTTAEVDTGQSFTEHKIITVILYYKHYTTAEVDIGQSFTEHKIITVKINPQHIISATPLPPFYNILLLSLCMIITVFLLYFTALVLPFISVNKESKKKKHLGLLFTWVTEATISFQVSDGRLAAFPTTLSDGPATGDAEGFSLSASMGDKSMGAQEQSDLYLENGRCRLKNVYLPCVYFSYNAFFVVVF